MPIATARRRALRALLMAPLALPAARLGVAAPKPEPAAAPPLLLLTTHVAGLAYYQIDQVRRALAPGDRLALRREPDNRYDARAIEVLTMRGVKLGYVPRHDNPPFAALMDAGRPVTARLTVFTDRRESARWAEIEMALYLAG